MTNPQQPYHFGFPSSVKAISFPGRPRIVTVEAQGITVNPGNYSYNGEPFSFVGPGGPTGPAGTSSIAPGATGPIGFKKPPATAPKIVQPFSTDMMNRLYSWEQPPNGYVSAGGTVGAGVIFVDFDNLVALAPKAKTIAFEIDTRSHGSSTPPGPPEIIWYICYTELAQSWSPGPLINATQNLATQSFFDYSPYLPPSVDPTNPAQDATFGGQAPSACDFSYQWQYNTAYQSTFGVPCPSGASTQAGAQTVVNNLGTLGLDSSYLQIFPWAIVPPPLMR